MAKNGEKKRASALEIDPLAYRREVPSGFVEVHKLEDVPYGEKTILVGRLMLSDATGKLSKFGLFSNLGGENIIILERIEGNGSSVPAYLTHTPENVKKINSVIHYGDIVMLDGNKLHIAGTDVFLGEEITLYSKAIGNVYDRDIDFRKKSNLCTHRHLQMIQDQGKILYFRQLSVALRTIRQFLYKEGYEELNMPLLQQKFEAGLADPFVTYAVDHNKEMYLRLTSELMLRKLMVAGFSKIFEISKSFRNQGATASTIPQFTILELYRAYADRMEMEDLIHDMICEILIQLYGIMSIPIPAGKIDCSGRWPSYDFKEEIKRYTGLAYDESYSIEELVHLLDNIGIVHPTKINKRTVANALLSYMISQITGPAFLRNLPAAQSPMFKVNDDESTVDETYLVINGMLIADLVNPERDPHILRKRMEEQLQYRKEGQDDSINEDIINAMKFGLPPCRGIGMGIERLFMLLLNAAEIKDVELFPVF